MASTVANSVRTKHTPPAKPADFMPEFKKAEKKPANLRQKTIDLMTRLVNIQNKKHG